MSRVKSFFAQVMDHPVLRVVLALALLVTSTGSMALAAYADDYVNGGVTWGAGASAVPLADVNPMGVNLFLEKEVEQEKVVKTLEMVRDGGYKWVRQGFAWNDIEINGKGIYTDTRNPGKVVNSWDKYDFIVQKAQENGLQIMARLDSPPLWARMPGDDVEQFHKGPPANNQDFGDFARAVAERYKGKIKYYQIWNEPNLWGEWGGHAINAEEYVELLKVAHDSIKSVDPDAVIVTAALAPTTDVSLRNLNDILFLEDMYKAGAAPYFDVFSTMLYGLGQSPEDRRADLDRLSFSRPILLREVMERNGDADKPIWISEYSWLSLPPNLMGDTELSRPPWEGGKNIWGDVVDEQTQARYLVEGYERARSEWPWMGPMFVWHFRNPDGDPREPATYFSIVNQDFTPRPAYEALKDYSARVPTTPVTQDKPLWNVVVFPLLYIITGAFALAAAAFSVIGVGRWASIALNRPTGRYSEWLCTATLNGCARSGETRRPWRAWPCCLDCTTVRATCRCWARPSRATGLLPCSSPRRPWRWWPSRSRSSGTRSSTAASTFPSPKRCCCWPSRQWQPAPSSGTSFPVWRRACTWSTAANLCLLLRLRGHRSPVTATAQALGL
jgi:hypothetical protein